MASGLPQGLLTNSQSISGNIERVDRVAIEDISRLWQVYSTNKAVLTDDVGFRLENFFWRIWGNESIHKRITGSEVALIFNEISQGRPIRTTPTSSPPTHRQYPIPEKENRPRSPTPSSKPTTTVAVASTPSSEEKEYEGSAVIVHDFASQAPQRPLASQSSESSRAPTRLPPILKKSDPVSGSLSKSARLQSPPAGLTQFNDEPQSVRAFQGLASRISSNSRRRESEDEVSLVRRTSDEMMEPKQGALPSQSAASPMPKSRAPGNSPIQGAGKKKKSVFLASTTTSRRRPSGIRRKSSQSSSGTTSKDISPGPAGYSDAISISSAVSSGNPVDATGEETSSSADFLSSKTELNTITNSSSNSARSPTRYPFRIERPSLSPQTSTSSQETATSQNPPQDALVSRDFRARFADRVPSKNVSFASLPTLAAKSKASVATLATQQASSNMPVAQKRGIMKSGLSENMAESSAEQAESAIEDDEPEVALSRTKSQLTLLLERHRRGEGVERGRKTSY